MTVKGYWLQLAVVACLLAVSVSVAPEQGVALASSADAAALTWQIEAVDAGPAVGTYASLALDAQGNPHVSYYDQGTADLKLARFDSATWQVETVDDGMVHDGPISLALDAAGRPHISYCVSDLTGGSDLWYAAYDGAEWQREPVTLETTPYAHLALDTAGGPHIAYQAGHLKYAKKVSGTWQVTSADSTPGAGQDLSLALDGGGQPHISYLDDGSDQLRYAWYDGLRWQIRTPDSSTLVRGYTSLALDGSGYPHIAYQSFYPEQGLRYTYFTGTAWVTEMADGAGNVGLYASLALDAAGQAHISYFDGDAGRLKIAYHDGTGWYTEIVDDDGTVGEYSSLALDAAGQPHIAYYDATHADLKHASDVPLRFHRTAAQLLEDVRGTELAPGWELAQLAAPVRPLYRPDVVGIAYYEFPVVVPAADSGQATAHDPAGYIVVASGDHDFTIPHWNFGGIAPTERLIALAAADGRTAVTFYQFDDASYVAEDDTGALVATLGEPVLKLSGMDPGWLDDPPESTSETWVPDLQIADRPDMPPISGTLVISGPTTPPPIEWSTWPSWPALKAGFGDAYYVPLEAVHREAQEEWGVKAQIAREGAALYKGDVHIMALLWPGVETSLSGPGAAYVDAQLLSREPLPPALQISVLDSVPGKSLALDVAVTYANGMTEVVHFQIVEPHRVWLPLVLRSGAGASLALTLPAAPQRPEDSYGPWTYYWAGTHADQRIYTQLQENQPPNTSDCVSGCGATAWAMLFGWVDYQASIGNPYWAERWGLYRADGGYGADAVAPAWMTQGVNNMTWEIRTHVKTTCPLPSAAGPDPGYTELWDMKYARKYTTGRSCVLVTTNWSSSPKKSHRNQAIQSIVERQTPAIVLNVKMDHYQLAYGYAWRCWNSAAGCLWRDHWFYVNQGHGDVNENKWVYRYMTHFVGRIYPCTQCTDDVAFYLPANHTWYYDYGHDGSTDAQMSYVTSDFRPVAGDFDRDGQLDDMALFYPIGAWLFDHDHDGGVAEEFSAWGQAGDLPAAGDFDRDGFVDDVAVYRPAEYKWYFDHDHDGITDAAITLGCSGCLPVAADFNRDGFVDDVALYSNVQPNWRVDYGHNGIVDLEFTLGCAGCLPLAADFDCDGHLDDVALYNPVTHHWFYDYDHNGVADDIVGPWGADGVLPVAGAFDGG